MIWKVKPRYHNSLWFLFNTIFTHISTSKQQMTNDFQQMKRSRIKIVSKWNNYNSIRYKSIPIYVIVHYFAWKHFKPFRCSLLWASSYNSSRDSRHCIFQPFKWQKIQFSKIFICLRLSSGTSQCTKPI